MWASPHEVMKKKGRQRDIELTIEVLCIDWSHVVCVLCHVYHFTFCCIIMGWSHASI